MSALNDLWGERYGSAAVATPPAFPEERAETVLRQMMSHRTVRAYTSEPLPESALPLMLAAAQSAASSSNLQTWSVVAVTDRERKSRLARAAASQAHIEEAPLLLVWLADLSRLDRAAARGGLPAEANDYFEMFLVAAVDTALAAQNASLAAEALGLGTSYIGAMRNKPEVVADELGLPAHVFAMFGLTVGYPDPARPASIKPRLPQSVVLHRETYSSEGESQPVGDYDEVMQAFQRGQGMRTLPWSQQASERVAGPQSLAGRHVLTDEIRKRGFGLK